MKTQATGQEEMQSNAIQEAGNEKTIMLRNFTHGLGLALVNMVINIRVS